jgi:protein phosphatase
MAARASRELVSGLHRALDAGAIDPGDLCDALLAADREVARSIAVHTHERGAATVVVCAGIDPMLSQWLVAWVGDCRVYRVSPAVHGAVDLLTLDDTYEHLGEAPPAGGSPHDPARMVGNGAVSQPNVRAVDVADGAMLVLCSDGVHKHVGAQEIGRVLRGTAPLHHRCARLLVLARARGSVDDATVLVVRRVAIPLALAPAGRP